MPLIVAELTGYLSSLFAFEYFNEAGAPVYSQASMKYKTTDAANAWADVFVRYGKNATAAGAPILLPSLEANRPAMVASLTTAFLLQPNPAIMANLVSAVAGLFFLAPCAFANGAVVSDVTLGQVAAATALSAMPPNPSSSAAASTAAGIFDTLIKTFLVLLPAGPPPVTILLASSGAWRSCLDRGTATCHCRERGSVRPNTA